MGRRRLTTALLVLALTMAFAAPAFVHAKGPGGGGGGGGGGGETTLANNLSVPTIMIGGGFTGVTCGASGAPSVLVAPSGEPRDGYAVDPAAYYYVQGVHKWQAQCTNDSAATVTAAWGDNLSGDAKLMVGKPIRVELGLFDDTGIAMDGYTVVKLEPDKLDRESAYGTLAALVDGTYSATPTTFTVVRVFDASATFSVRRVDTGEYVVQPLTNPTAEINATGSVVYGYNLRVTTAGAYEITFVTPSVTIVGTDAGVFTATTATITINVIGGGGGGGGKGR